MWQWRHHPLGWSATTSSASSSHSCSSSSRPGWSLSRQASPCCSAIIASSQACSSASGAIVAIASASASIPAPSCSSRYLSASAATSFEGSQEPFHKVKGGTNSTAATFSPNALGACEAVGAATPPFTPPATPPPATPPPATPPPSRPATPALNVLCPSIASNASSSSIAHESRPNLRSASCAAVQPSALAWAGSAPARMSSLIVSLWPRRVATHSGVSPLLLAASTIAPAARSTSAALTLPAYAAE
mmetsp:Transcript_33725/g.76348  ORF Transcript_33725/g.76348 Transcript_33725/m.76348 type:complete len:247 (-) Transcript_33725:171-911(-)